MTLNLSEAKNHGCRPHPRGSVRRASGFVLTGNTVANSAKAREINEKTFLKQRRQGIIEVGSLGKAP